MRIRDEDDDRRIGNERMHIRNAMRLCNMEGGSSTVITSSFSPFWWPSLLESACKVEFRADEPEYELVERTIQAA